MNALVSTVTSMCDSYLNHRVTDLDKLLIANMNALVSALSLTPTCDSYLKSWEPLNNYQTFR